MDRLGLLSGWRSEAFEGALQLAVHEVGVDQRCGEITVAEGSLNHQDVPCSAVEVSSEGVSEGVRAELPVNACGIEPILQPPGDLSLAKPPASVGEEQCPASAIIQLSALCEVGSEEGS